MLQKSVLFFPYYSSASLTEIGLDLDLVQPDGIVLVSWNCVIDAPPTFLTWQMCN